MKVTVGDRVVSLSNLEKVIYPGGEVTKAAVIRYYLQVSERMLPHIRGRPVTMKRFPDGPGGQSFFEKRCPEYAPDWINRSVRERSNGERFVQCTLDDAASLVWAANLAALEIHVTLSRGEEHEKATLALFDLDPRPPADLTTCSEVALRVRDLLRGYGLKSLVKTSGGKGLHILVPLNDGTDMDAVRTFVKENALALARSDDRITTSYRKKRGTVLIDWRQNSVAFTMIAPYSLRARLAPVVSAPVMWDEVEKGDVKDLLMDDVLKRVEEHGDILEELPRMKQDLR